MIDFETVNIFLRNNQHVTIRPAFSSEANEVADFFKTVTEETEFLSKQADEASSPGEFWNVQKILCLLSPNQTEKSSAWVRSFFAIKKRAVIAQPFPLQSKRNSGGWGLELL